ncbi:MAG: hypothetical protein LIP12_17815 [Clostridiales bacterium]|nr:hypothetical protein [Clostridiales bacterium]
MSKLASRKLWMSIASMLASIATSIAGINTGNETLATVGVICAVVSAAIYAGCEAYVDASAAATEITYYVDDEKEESEEE